MEENTHEADARREAFRELARDLLAELPPSAHRLTGHVADALPAWRVPRDVTDLGPEFEAAVRQAHSVLGDTSVVGRFSAALVAGLAVDLPARLRSRRLTPDVVAQVPPALDRLLQFLRTADLTDYRWDSASNDYFLKDIRFVAGLTVPVGAGVVDLRGVIGRRRTLALAVQKRSLPAAVALLRGKGLEPWFSFHTEARYLAEFDEPGWDRAYLRMASLLAEHPQVRGITAAGWLYDPQISEISPRHAHLHRRPLERGAVLVPEKTQQHDIDNAVAKSTTRQRLYESGQYVPAPHTMLWPRKQLLAWARRDARAARS